MLKDFRYLLFGLILGFSGLPWPVQPAAGALLDGLMGGVEESLGKRAEAKGEQLIIGNFYQAERPDSHAPIGVMGDHTHNKGELMFAYRYMRMFMDGNRDGTNNVSASNVLNSYAITPLQMTTQMHMFSAMYGLNDTVTLMAMLPYVMKSMDHRNRAGVKFTTNASGFGDFKVGALWRLYAFETPSIGAHRFHLNTGLSLPTGDINPTDKTPLGNNSLLPYPMRLGSGTVDLLPGLTYTGVLHNVSWGLQALGTVRLGENQQGYREGHRYQINTWGAYRWAEWISTSARFNWQQWGNIKSRDGQLQTTIGPMNIPLVQTVDPDLQAGKRLDIMGGVNILFPEWIGLENHLNVEAGLPIYQYLDGPQLKQSWSFWAGWQIIM
ncbi:MAG TPA: hypothetical protein PKK23_16760 [Nitrospirales bacterium]|nr:hypothetical protein [Nitrospirales bacterium]